MHPLHRLFVAFPPEICQRRAHAQIDDTESEENNKLCFHVFFLEFICYLFKFHTKTENCLLSKKKEKEKKSVVDKFSSAKLAQIQPKFFQWKTM